MQIYERGAERAVVVLQRCDVEVVVRRLRELKYSAPQSGVVDGRCGLLEKLAKAVVLLDSPTGGAIPMRASTSTA